MSEVLLSPYAQGLGLRTEGSSEDGAPVLICDPVHQVMGRPGFWHGGAIGGILEIAAYAAVRARLGNDAHLKPVGLAVQYLRGGIGDQPMYACGHIERAGRRLINVTVDAWQDDRSRLIATAQIKMLLRQPGRGAE